MLIAAIVFFGLAFFFGVLFIAGVEEEYVRREMNIRARIREGKKIRNKVN